ncbi:hypothetical protein HYW60_01890 [Candidatus Kaiserbacteria bacterium]|nr:hypothetical protein [Candidatus Kaiserbacteria bacterium]
MRKVSIASVIALFLSLSGVSAGELGFPGGEYTSGEHYNVPIQIFCGTQEQAEKVIDSYPYLSIDNFSGNEAMAPDTCVRGWSVDFNYGAPEKVITLTDRLREFTVHKVNVLGYAPREDSPETAPLPKPLEQHMITWTWIERADAAPANGRPFIWHHRDTFSS